MQSDPQSSRDGRSSPSAQAELQELRSTCRQQAHDHRQADEDADLRPALRRPRGRDVGGPRWRSTRTRRPPRARSWPTSWASASRRSVLHDALLLVSELTSNSVRHSGIGPEGELVLRVRLLGASVLIDVQDLGVSGVPALHEPTPDGDGLGLHIVQALSEAWGMERDAAVGTRVWARIGTAAIPSSLPPLP